MTDRNDNKSRIKKSVGERTMSISGVRIVALHILLTCALAISHSANAKTFAYVGNAGSNEITVFVIDSKGELTLVEKAPFAGVEKPGASTPLAVSPDHHYLFAGVRSEPYVAVAFAINPVTGKLKHLGNGPLVDSMAYISTDRAGKFLLSASYGGNKIAVNPIGADGVVKPPVAVIPTGPNAHAILTDPLNHYVLATNLGSDTVLDYRFDAATGRLTPNKPPSIKVADKSGPRHFVFHPNNKFVYLIHELSGAIVVFGYDAKTGHLRELQMTSALPDGFKDKYEKPWAADIHLTPDGRFLYASERTSSTIKAFKVNPRDGKLTPAASVPTEKQPRGFNIDPTGHYLAAAGEKSDGVTVYAIDQKTGALTNLKSYPVGKSPNWIEFVSFPSSR
jgi:6-phosphogluconolactonase